MAKVSPLLLIPPVVFAGLAALFLWGMGRSDPDADLTRLVLSLTKSELSD